MLPPLVPQAGAPPCPTPQRPRRRPPLVSARSSGKPAGIEDGARGAIDPLLRALDRFDRRRNAGPAPPPLDEEDESAARFDAGPDERATTVADDEARAAARGNPDGGAPQSPARASICLQSSDFSRSDEKPISKYFDNERICRAMRPAPIPTGIVIPGPPRRVRRCGDGAVRTLSRDGDRAWRRDLLAQQAREAGGGSKG